MAAGDKDRIARRWRVFGIVQGVGFRPFVSRLAAAHAILGSVCNKGSYVEILAQGSDRDMAAFRRALTTNAPERAAIMRVTEKALPLFVAQGFAIIESAREGGA
ncbi:MAG: acylphosphatase, partial [Negativicutes bacterium]